MDAPITEAAFWARVDRSGGPDSCWPWTGGRFRAGYGNVGRSTYAHRLAVLFDGRDPSGMIVMHTCDNPPCVNPAHLVVATHQDNMRDAKDKGLMTGAINPGCGEDAPNARLTWKDVEEIRSRRRAGTLLSTLAQEFGVTETNISYIVRGTTWKGR